MELQVEMLSVLAANAWQLQFDDLPDKKFTLKAGEKRQVQLKLRQSTEFTKADIEGMTDPMINVSVLANDLVLGGISYHADPNLNAPSGGKQPMGKACDTAAQDLLNCLKISSNRKLKKVRVNKISLDIELDNDCD